MEIRGGQHSDGPRGIGRGLALKDGQQALCPRAALGLLQKHPETPLSDKEKVTGFFFFFGFNSDTLALSP